MNRLYTIIFLLLLTVSSSFGQRDLTIHFLNKINQSNYSNPSFIPENNFSIGLPLLSAIAVDFSHSGFKYKELVLKDSLSANFDNIVDNVLNDKNYLSTEFSTDLIAVKFKIKGLYFGINATERIAFRFDYTKDMLGILRGNGWYAERNRDINLSPELDAIHYREYGASGALKIKKFTVGARLKLLTGLTNVSTERSNVTIHTNPDSYAITANSDYQVNMSLPDTANFDPMGYAFNFKNVGMGIDLGGTFDLTEKISFAASIVDFGYINWKSNVTNYSNDNASYTFEGIEFKDLTDENGDISGEAILDTLKKRFDAKETHNEYQTTLTPKVYLSGSIKVTKNDKFGVLFYSEYFKRLHPAITLAYNRNFGNWYTGGLTYSIFNNDYFNIGFGSGFKLGPVQIYTVADNLLGAFLPKSTNNFNFRFGINLVFGKPKEKKDAPAPLTPPPPAN